MSLAALILALCLSTATASATCGTKSPPDYGDIEAVMLARNYDTEPHARPTRYRHTVPSIDRSTFWVLFWETGPAKFPTVYSQFDLQGMVGTYHLSAKLADAIAILRRDDYFQLSPVDYMITDTAQLVLTVKRCAVITRIAMYSPPPEEEEQPARRLFDDLAALISSSQAMKMSSAPSDFDETLLFNP